MINGDFDDNNHLVTRAGVSMVASGMASEVFINEIQRRLNKPIGSTPSFIRGVVGSTFEMSEYENSKFENCLACSRTVAEEYLNDKKGFLFKVKLFFELTC
jgi:hypothetical protein